MEAQVNSRPSQLISRERAPVPTEPKVGWTAQKAQCFPEEKSLMPPLGITTCTAQTKDYFSIPIMYPSSHLSEN